MGKSAGRFAVQKGDLLDAKSFEESRHRDSSHRVNPIHDDAEVAFPDHLRIDIREIQNRLDVGVQIIRFPQRTDFIVRDGVVLSAVGVIQDGSSILLIQKFPGIITLVLLFTAIFSTISVVLERQS